MASCVAPGRWRKSQEEDFNDRREPIETAPRGGTPLLLWLPAPLSKPTIGHWKSYQQWLITSIIRHRMRWKAGLSLELINRRWYYWAAQGAQRVQGTQKLLGGSYSPRTRFTALVRSYSASYFPPDLFLP